MNNTISLRKATIKDIQALLEIEQTTVGLKTYSGYFTGDEIMDYINNDVVYLIKQNNEIVGSVSYEIKNKDHAYISGLVVKPKFQRQGLARQALITLFKELHKFKIVDLVVHPDNDAARTIYESLGFVSGERKENFYGDGEPRLIMTLKR